MIENPQPGWLPFLLLALPGIGFAAYAVNKFLFPNDDRPLCTVGAIGLVLALLPTHLLALATGSLNLGLAGAWIGIGAGGYAWLGHHWQKFPPRIRGGSELGYRLGVAALATLPIVLPTILLNFHDKPILAATRRLSRICKTARIHPVIFMSRASRYVIIMASILRLRLSRVCCASAS